MLDNDHLIVLSGATLLLHLEALHELLKAADQPLLAFSNPFLNQLMRIDRFCKGRFVLRKGLKLALTLSL